MADWNSKANDVFLRAAEIESAAERRLILDQPAATTWAYVRKSNRCWQRSEKMGSFLNKPAVQAPPGSPETVDYEPIAERPGTVIGPYKLMEQIGEGGMGLVFVAEQQQPVRRKVALKVIKPGMDSREVIARFEAERQALALMDHPNIAQRPRRRHDRERPALLRHGAGQGHPDHRLLRPAAAHGPRAAGAVRLRSARRCSTPTARGSSTATSSRPTSWSPRTTACRWSR